MASDPQDAYVQMLTENLQRAIDWLRFAEAKNAALLAFTSGWIGFTLNLECSGKSLPRGFTISLWVTLLCALCAAVLAMVSFLPHLHLPSFLGGTRAGLHPPNLLYFGDISALPIKTLEHDISVRYLSTGQEYRDEYIHDLIVQLSANCAITMRKMRLFDWGLKFVLVGSVFLLVPTLRLVFVAVKSLW